ncbi:MAG: hypothetical protein QG662_732 [Pseudomonadota bacterium]|nr:hypothetical protein [Pseudomonadota bacterium]
MSEQDDFPGDADDLLDEIMLSRLAGVDTPKMDIDAYRNLISDIAPPTNGQIVAFAGYVASARSWYKHLPLIPPGGDFYFYIDPHAGMDHLVHASGEVTVRTRTQDTEPFHYSWMSTADYRARFGCLAFACRMGSNLFRDERLGDEIVLVDNNCLNPALQVTRDSAMTPPKEVLEAGTCSLTALIQPHATDDDIRRVSAEPVFTGHVVVECARHRQQMIETMWRMRSVAYPDSPKYISTTQSVLNGTFKIDVFSEILDYVLQSSAPYEEKMSRLESLEPAIEVAFALGLTCVKPVGLITADDLDC